MTWRSGSRAGSPADGPRPGARWRGGGPGGSTGRWRGPSSASGPGRSFVFSDVGSRFALPKCRELGIPAVLSMVHGDVREEREVLEREAEVSPEFFGLYLGDGTLDRDELDWLHARRLRELELADRVLVPSEHIAETLVAHGTPREKLSVVPYAADTRRFRPDPAKAARARAARSCSPGGSASGRGSSTCSKPGGGSAGRAGGCNSSAPCRATRGRSGRTLDGVELLGRVGHAEVPARMAAADVFVFPSLFEGSAVVTYEALACGLPCVVTPSAGSVVRDGVEGFLVPAGRRSSRWPNGWSGWATTRRSARRCRPPRGRGPRRSTGRAITRRSSTPCGRSLAGRRGWSHERPGVRLRDRRP